MTFNSREQNIFHYLTFVTFQRVPVFRSSTICQFFVDAIRETREKHPFKLIAYVIMPDHVHLIINPLKCYIEVIGKELKGRSAHKTIKWLKESGHITSLNKLKRRIPGKRNHSFSMWQEKVKSVDLKSEKFIHQKVDYVHMNPVRAGLCGHPADWKWSSYHAYLPHEPAEVPIEMDKQPYWTEEEIETGIDNHECGYARRS